MRPTHSTREASHRAAANSLLDANRINWSPNMLVAATAVRNPGPLRWLRNSLRMAAGCRIKRTSINTQRSGNAARLTANKAAATSSYPSRMAARETMPVVMTNAKLPPGRLNTIAANADRRGSWPFASPASNRRRPTGETPPRRVSSAALWWSHWPLDSAASGRPCFNLRHSPRLKTLTCAQDSGPVRLHAVDKPHGRSAVEGGEHHDSEQCRRNFGGSRKPCARAQARQHPVQRLPQCVNCGTRVRRLY